MNGISGPLFISIGDSAKLNVFLDANPTVPRNLAFVDGYDFDAYSKAGFGMFSFLVSFCSLLFFMIPFVKGVLGDNKDADTMKAAAKRMQAPALSGKQWWTYLTTVGKVSPIPPGLKFGEVPQGVLRLGGTFAVDGDAVKYAHRDVVPGDHPDIDSVIKSFR